MWSLRSGRKGWISSGVHFSSILEMCQSLKKWAVIQIQVLLFLCSNWRYLHLTFSKRPLPYQNAQLEDFFWKQRWQKAEAEVRREETEGRSGQWRNSLGGGGRWMNWRGNGAETNQASILGTGWEENKHPHKHRGIGLARLGTIHPVSNTGGWVGGVWLDGTEFISLLTFLDSLARSLSASHSHSFFFFFFSLFQSGVIFNVIPLILSSVSHSLPIVAHGWILFYLGPPSYLYFSYTCLLLFYLPQSFTLMTRGDGARLHRSSLTYTSELYDGLL